jgi:hypothetical protein
MNGCPRPRPEPGNGEPLIVRFPSPAGPRQAWKATWTRWKGLLPRRWRRQVVISGQRFWLPG